MMPATLAALAVAHYYRPRYAPLSPRRRPTLAERIAAALRRLLVPR